MVVTIHGNGHNEIGLRVGEANARRYFSREMGAVELRLGDLQIQCKLSPDFWDGQPEIHDPRLCLWLKFKASRQSANRKPIALAMEQSGANSFTLHPISLAAKRAHRVASAA